MALVKLGVPTVLIVTSAFLALARTLARVGKVDVDMLVVEHPLGGLKPEAVGERAALAVEQLLNGGPHLAALDVARLTRR
jgi:hypothetical protein